MSFVLHPRLLADTAPVADWTLSRVLLMNDSRFPWIVLVPRRADLIELFDLDEAARGVLMGEMARVAENLKSWSRARGGGDKINVAAIGNLVPQLHVHVVARHGKDFAWPGPVWGAGQAVPYDSRELAALASRLREIL
jgi:diadenosine tetraphosphate (Ap4A) HIT family hydrolase